MPDCPSVEDLIPRGMSDTRWVQNTAEVGITCHLLPLSPQICCTAENTHSRQ
jgi:hypothetical protein